MGKTSSGRFVATLALMGWVGGLAVIGCEASPPSEGQPSPVADAGNAPTPCEEAFGEACGAACSDDTGCAAGLHCAAGICAADCIVASDCASSECSPQGRCVEGDTTPIDDSNIKVTPVETDPTDTDDPPECIEGQVEFVAVMPQVWLLLDMSGSMSELLDVSSRWDALGAVVVGDPANPTDRGVVGDFEDRVAFGAVFYTSGSGPAGCALDLESIALATNSYTAIRQRYNKVGPSGGTPTADAVAATVAVAATSDLTGGQKILVLATDGVPGDCSYRPGTPTLEVEKEVGKAFDKGIQTFAVSIATDTDASHMQRVANIGVGLPADAATPAPYYTAESQEALKLAFSTIIEDVPRSCVFSLNGKVEEENAGEGTVTLAGVELVYGDANGWILKQADEVELVGTACEQIQAGEEDLDITFPCEVFTPVPR
ncbi:MAG TPA: VWA domain-containing protein [Polyangiaceae bacterium]|nr:VWA domain-containing protein [Polyangiaceae bacterium]